MIEREIYLVRHGETDYNLKRIIQGRGVDSSINETGREQAQAFFEFHRNIPFNQLFTSTLKRTQQTMQPFIDAGYKHQAFHQLDEINWGVHEGRTGDTHLSDEYLDITGKWRSGELHHSIPEGESPLELQLRQRDFIENILPQYTGKILICSHGRAMRSLICTMLNEPLSKMDEFPHTNLSLYKLIYSAGAFQMELFNFTGHLKK